MIDVQFVLLLLATFWVWETLRLPAERYVPNAFATSRPLHPFIVAALPLYVLWPDWVAALAVAGAAGLLVAVVDMALSPPAPVVLPTPTRRTGRQLGLPPL